MSIYSSAPNGASEKGVESVKPEPTFERFETVNHGPRFTAPRPLPTAAVSTTFRELVILPTMFTDQNAYRPHFRSELSLQP